ncbi:hypothetical protein AX761_06200 [Rhizobium sp. 58]|nr:hypothetical protein AX761_06200 [Rhizobium sp. 58]
MAKKSSVEPALKTIAGIEFAIIPLSQYVELLKAQDKLEKAGLGRLKLERRARGFIERHPAIASFFADRVNSQSLSQAHEECEIAFGANMTPSISAIGRYWQSLRVKAALARLEAA